MTEFLVYLYGLAGVGTLVAMADVAKKQGDEIPAWFLVICAVLWPLVWAAFFASLLMHLSDLVERRALAERAERAASPASAPESDMAPTR